MAKASNKDLEALHAIVAQALTEKIKSGEATAADIQAAIKFLKDNLITASPQPGTPLGDLVESLPFDVHDERLN